ncbi:manganese efflux pump MntP family protein [Paenibacillus sp. IITD108]
MGEIILIEAIGAGQVITLIIIALALGFDAFSLGLGIGMRGIRLWHIARLGFLIGLFHFLMPVFGMMMGRWVNQLLGDVAVTLAGCLFILLGVHMIYSSFKSESKSIFNHYSFWGMIVIAFSVSVDAFSVGVTLGMFSADFWLTILLIGMLGGVMSVLGLLLGRKVSGKLGEYGEACGGAILLGFGILFML